MVFCWRFDTEAGEKDNWEAVRARVSKTA